MQLSDVPISQETRDKIESHFNKGALRGVQTSRLLQLYDMHVLAKTVHSLLGDGLDHLTSEQLGNVLEVIVLAVGAVIDERIPIPA